MWLRANMGGIDKCFDRRKRVTEVKEPEKNAEDLNKWNRAGEGTLSAQNCMGRGRGEGMAVASSLVMEKAS